MGRTLPGFEVVDHPGARILARPEAVNWVRFVLEGGSDLYGAAGRDPGALGLKGRRTVFVIPAKIPEPGVHPEGTQWAVRHYARGWRPASALLDDRFFRWGRVRPYHEARASDVARERGIPTPRVVAAAQYPRGPFYRADIVTEFIPKGMDLVAALFDTGRKGLSGSIERREALGAAGTLIRDLANAGLRHRDIHAGNILLEWRGTAPSPHLLDLDRCEVKATGKTLSPGSMLGRLKRSLRKWVRLTGLQISKTEWEILESAAADR